MLSLPKDSDGSLTAFNSCSVLVLNQDFKENVHTVLGGTLFDWRSQMTDVRSFSYELDFTLSSLDTLYDFVINQQNLDLKLSI